MRLLLLLVASALVSRAEFLEVRLQVNDMDCETCVKSLEIALRKMKGMKTVKVRPELGGAEFILVPGNKLTLEQLRDYIKGVGFRPMAADVVARGRATTADGSWRFTVDGIEKSYMLSAANEDVMKVLRTEDGRTVTVRARSQPPPDPRTTPILEVMELSAGR